MPTEVEYTDEYGAWNDALDAHAQASIDAAVERVREYGPALGYPHSSQIQCSRHGGMRELRIQTKGRPFRVFYAFDPRRVALMLIGGNKQGKDDRWYNKIVLIADRLFDAHLRRLRVETDQYENTEYRQ